METNFKVSIQAANRASAHNHFHLYYDTTDGVRDYHGSYMTMSRTQAFASTLLNPAVYDRKGKPVALIARADVTDHDVSQDKKPTI
jgi:hypothetical protein